MPGSFVTTASAPTSATCCVTSPVSTITTSTSSSAATRTVPSPRSSARTSVPCRNDRGGYSVREQLALPLDLRRERADLFHAPHYVLPPLTPCRSVVTIHDCIHLRFPQYLPNRLGYAYARTSMWFATHRAARVLTVSEASKRDILEYFDVPESKITVIYNAIDERFSEEPPADEVMRVRERYQLNDPFILYAGNIKPHKNLERLIEAFHIIRKGELEFVKLLIIGDEISKYATLRRTVHRYKLHKHVRFFGFVPDATLAILYRLAARLRLPVALRGIRPAAARGDGERHAGDHLERLLAARSRRRRGDADRSLRDRRDRRRDAPRPDWTTGCATTCASAAWRGRASSRGAARSAASGRSTTRCWRGERHAPSAPGRPGPRLADRHARRREGARRHLRDLSGRAAPHAACASRDRCRPASKRGRSAPRSCRRSPRPARFYRHYLPLYPLAVELFDFDGVRPGHQQQPLRREVRRSCPAGRGPRLLLPLADAVCVGPVRRVLRAGAGRAG